jgi:hypothetical protein
MSIPNARKGRHAAPGRTTGRRLATAAAALAAGAVPLASAGTAAAAAGNALPQADLPSLGLPNVALPFGLPDSIDPLTAGVPLVQDLPLSDTVNEMMPPVGDVLQVGDLGLLPQRALPASSLVRAAAPAVEPQVGVRTTALDTTALNTSGLATMSNRALTDGAERTAARLASTLPLANLMPQLASTADGPLQLAPNILHEGALGTLTSGFAPQTGDLTGGLVGQAEPLVAQLHKTGVPTVGDLTAKLSQTSLPVVGPVGSLTGTLPVTTMLGTNSPITGAVQNLSGL